MNLSINDMLSKLQEEYVACVIRSNIYPDGKHTKYWEKVSQMKKERILDISRKNQLPSIFDDSRIMDAFKDKVLEGDMPVKFYYTPKMSQDQRYWDLFNYFKEGSQVILDDQYHCIIIQSSIASERCILKLVNTGEIIKFVHFSRITRKDI